MKRFNIYSVIPGVILFLIIAISPLSAEDYYVDAVNGSDSNNGLTPSTAWKTVDKVNSSMSLFAPGDNILFKRGQSFKGQGELFITASGASGNYLVFGAYGTGLRPLLDKIMCTKSDLGYVTVKDFRFKSGVTGIAFLGVNSHHIIISNCHIEDMSNNGIFLKHLDTYLVQYCVITNCSNSGIAVIGSGISKIRNGTIRNNTVYNIINNDGITLHKEDVTMNECGSNHSLINNVCYNCAENGLDITSGSNILLRGNETYNNKEPGTLIGGIEVSDVRVDRHYSHEDYIGIAFGGVTNVTMTSSIIYNADYHQITLNPETTLSNFQAYHNTFVFGPNSSGLIMDIGTGASNLTLKNNIFISTKYSDPKTYIRFMDQITPASTKSHFDYNTYWRLDGDSSGRWKVLDNISFSTWQNTWGQDIHGQFINPRLVSLTGRDYHLQSTSPCIDAGVSTLTSRDFEGTEIPQGAAPDNGAYEYVVESPPPSPLVANAGASPQTGEVPLTVSFTGSATGGTSPYSYRWTFGDGQSSTAQNPEHTYTQTGSFTATLTVTDSENKTDTSSVVITVSPAVPSVLNASMTAVPASGEIPLTVSFTGSATGGTPPYSYRWTFGDGQSSTAQNPGHTYTQTGSFTATLTVTDNEGKTDAASRIIQVYEKSVDPLKIILSASEVSGVAPLSVSFAAIPSGGAPPYTYDWKFGNGDSSDQKKTTYVFAEAGNFHVTLTVTDSHNNAVAKTLTIFVKEANLKPIIFCAPGSLAFGASTTGTHTSGQHFHIFNEGLGLLNWSVTTDKGWLSCSPSSGTGSGRVLVRVNPAVLSPGEHKAKISVFDSQGSIPPQHITVSLDVYNNDSPPFGGIDSPPDDSHVVGNIPISGWALDDVEVTRIAIKRAADPYDVPEKIGSDGLVHLGDAVFLDDARPGIQGLYPDYPMNHRAGWGYTLHTYQLPNMGKGNFMIYAVAIDSAGQNTVLGTKRISCDSTNNELPFGAIESPEGRERISGEEYTSSGWVLIPPPRTIPLDGSTIWVWIDGVQKGHPVYNQYREDIAALFSEYHNSQGAGGYFSFDPTQLQNGAHTIMWSVENDAGGTDATEAVYFLVENEGMSHQLSYIESKGFYQEDTEGLLNLDIDEVRWDFALDSTTKTHGEENGTYTIEAEEMEPLEIRFKTNSESVLAFFGFGEQEWKSLPVGSTLRHEEGVFSWIPTPGLIGTYTLHFAFTDGIFISRPLCVKVKVSAKTYDQSKQKQRKIKR